MYKDFIALKKPIHEIFSVTKRKGILPPPVAMKNGGGRKFDNNEFYDYHKQRGHSTQKCYQLKNAIEDVIRHGWLKEFVDKHSSCKEEKPQRKRKHNDDEKDEVDNHKTMSDTGKAQVQIDGDKNYPGIVHTIVGGPLAVKYTLSSSSTSSSKRSKDHELYQVEAKRTKVDNTIVFTDEDFIGVQTPHQDASCN